MTKPNARWPKQNLQPALQLLVIMDVLIAMHPAFQPYASNDDNTQSTSPQRQHKW